MFKKSRLEKAAKLKAGAAVISKVDDKYSYALTKDKKYNLIEDAIPFHSEKDVFFDVRFPIINDLGKEIRITYVVFRF